MAGSYYCPFWARQRRSWAGNGRTGKQRAEGAAASGGKGTGYYGGRLLWLGTV